MLPTPETGDLDYDKVYEPSEDTFLLLDCFERELKFLQQKLDDNVCGSSLVTEIGTGSGMVTSFIMANILPNSLYIATDINPNACQSCLETADINKRQLQLVVLVVDCCQMDLTRAFIPNCIDLLVFNPPYVPAETVPDIPDNQDDSKWLDLALLGGPTGMTVTWQLLNQLEQVLTVNGVAYILFCARNEPHKVKEIMESRGWEVCEIIQRKAGWEVLSVLRFIKQS